MSKITKTQSIKETVEQYLARSGVVTQLKQGETGGQVWPVSRARKEHIEYIKSLDRMRLAARGIGEPTAG